MCKELELIKEDEANASEQEEGQEEGNDPLALFIPCDLLTSLVILYMITLKKLSAKFLFPLDPNGS